MNVDVVSDHSVRVLPVLRFNYFDFDGCLNKTYEYCIALVLFNCSRLFHYTSIITYYEIKACIIRNSKPCTSILAQTFQPRPAAD